jgi:hypothetical protein
MNMYPAIYRSIYLSIDLSIYLSIDLSIYQSIYNYIYIYLNLNLYLYLYLSNYLSIYIYIMAIQWNINSCKVNIYIYIILWGFPKSWGYPKIIQGIATLRRFPPAKWKFMVIQRNIPMNRWLYSHELYSWFIQCMFILYIYTWRFPKMELPQ